MRNLWNSHLTYTPIEYLFLLKCKGKASEWKVILSIRSFLMVKLWYYSYFLYVSMCSYSIIHLTWYVQYGANGALEYTLCNVHSVDGMVSLQFLPIG
jgi:membrane-associated HD superfamily phosphohydrolase